MNKSILYVLAISAIVFSSCGSKIPEEKQEEMQALLHQTIMGTLIDKAKYSFSDFQYEITKISEKRYELDGEKFGTYVGDFKYSFTDDDGKNVKVFGQCVFSHDATISFVNGCSGIFIDAIMVNGNDENIRTSEYYFDPCDWE